RRRGPGRGRAFCGHRRAVPGARRRLVEPRRRGAQSVHARSRSGDRRRAEHYSRHAGSAGGRAMTKRMVIMLAAVALVFGGVFGFQAFKAAMIKKFMSTMAQPPQTVTADKANASEWQPKITAVGSLRAVSGADLSLEVSGVVDSIAFNSGDDVEKGTQLLK